MALNFEAAAGAAPVLLTGSATSVLLSSLLAAQQGADTTAAPPQQPPDDQAAPTIVVTGTRIVAPNRRSTSPVETVRPIDFTLTGVPNVEQTLNQLPQIVPSFTNTSNNPGSGAATLDLRGLGSVRTLILVNGRRWIANDAGQIPEIDVNTIPSALIDRVDIVTGGASAVYGSDAVTGVINFVLKSRLEGLHLEARNSITERGDARVSSADLSYGASFDEGRANVILSAGWLDQAPVLSAARDFAEITLGDGCIIAGSEGEFGIGTPAPNPDFECNDEGEVLGFIRGASNIIPEGLIASAGFFPTGSGSGLARLLGLRFTPDGSLTQFIAAQDAFNTAPDTYLQVALQRISANILGSWELSPQFEPYTELSYIRTRSPQQLAVATGILGTGAGTVPFVLINLDNPFLSEQARQVLDISYGIDAEGDRGFVGSPAAGFQINPVFSGDADGIVRLPGQFRTRLTGLGPRRVENERNAYRGLIGARGKISSAFDYDAYFSISDVKHDTPLRNSASASRLQQAMLARLDPATGEIVCIDPSNGCVPVNIFGVQDISAAAAEFIGVDVREETRVKEQIAEATVRGVIAELPAGELRTALGTQLRKTSFDYRPDRILELGDNLGFNPSIGSSGKTKVIEIFGEALVPILRDQPLASELTAELGLRFSDYDSVGGVWTWKATGSWSPVRQVRLRGGFQKAVRAPNARELFEELNSSPGFVIDPCAPDSGLFDDPEIAAACVRVGAGSLPPGSGVFPLFTTSGSTDLEAETARTFTMGVAVQPLPEVAFTVDYYDIRIRDAIGVFGGGGQFTLFGCIIGGGGPESELCQAIERDQDGNIVEVITPTANLARIRASGIDWQLSYGRRLLKGDFRLNLSGTRLIRNDFQPNRGLDPIACAGTFGPPCGFTLLGTASPRWKLYNRFAWASGPLTLTVRHRYFSTTRQARFNAAEVLGLPSPGFQIPERGHELESRNYFDGAVAFDIASRFELTLGVNNLTDAKPSLVGSGQVQANTDPSLYDVLGRRFFATLRARLR